MGENFIAQVWVTFHHFAKGCAKDLFFDLIGINFAAVFPLHFDQRGGERDGRAGDTPTLSAFFVAQRLKVTLKKRLIAYLWA